jgi:hypothetical protein
MSARDGRDQAGLAPHAAASRAIAVSATAAAQDLKYAACMRARGIPGFPGPVVQANSVRWGNGHFNSHSPVFRSAQGSCRHFLPGGGAP